MIKVVTFWYSLVVFKLLSNVHKNLFKKVERISKKQGNVQQHLKYNLKCLKEDFLPIHTNIYMQYIKLLDF